MSIFLEHSNIGTTEKKYIAKNKNLIQMHQMNKLMILWYYWNPNLACKTKYFKEKREFLLNFLQSSKFKYIINIKL